METPIMRRTPTFFAPLLLGLAVSACGENSPGSRAETSPAVSAPAKGVPPRVAPPATAAAAAAPSAAQGGLQGGSDDWRQVASAADASLLGRLDQAWRMARAEAEAAGFASEVEALGPLVDPNAALPDRLQPPPGTYRCRTIKLGRRGEGTGLAYVDYPWFACSVETTPGGDLVLTKTTGSQRTQGLLYPAYGDRPERDQVGVLERIGQSRWRLVLPWPKQEAKLELLEIRT
jgi:hypothetical protein